MTAHDRRAAESENTTAMPPGKTDNATPTTDAAPNTAAPRLRAAIHVDAFVDGGHHARHAPPKIGRLVDLLRPDGSDIRLILLFAVAAGLLSLASPIAVEALVNSVAFGGLLQPIVVLALILMACLSLSAGMNLLQHYVAELIQRRIFARTAEDLAMRLPRVETSSWDSHDAAKMVNRFFEVVTIQKIVSSLLLDGVSLFLAASIGMIVLAFYHPILLVFDIGLILTIALVLLSAGRQGVSTAVDESAAKHAVAGWLEEISRPRAAFRSESGGSLAEAVAAELTLDYLRRRSRHFRVVFRQSVFAWTAYVVTSVLMLGLGGWLVLVGQMTLGQLVAAELILTVVASSIAKLGKHLEAYYDLMASIDKLETLRHLPLERSRAEAPTGEGRGVRLRVIGLSIGVGRQPPLAEAVNLEIEPGDAVAVVGGEGVGKSLFGQILTAKRPALAGAIEVDGVDLRRWDPRVLRDRVVLIDDEGVVETSVLENVRLGRSEITADDVRAALDAVGLLEEVMKLADGLDTRVTVHGAPLSSGQRQRLLVARALAARPGLLILDSVLDGLDETRRRRTWKSIRTKYACSVLLLTRRGEVAGLCNEQLPLPSSGARHSQPTESE